MPMKRKRIWIVVADGARARFLTPKSGNEGLVAARAETYSSPESRGHSRDLKSDRPGRSLSSSRLGLRHAIEPHHDYHKLEKHKFAARVAKLLDQACAKRQFDELILVAPRRSLGEFRSLLSRRVQARIRQEVAKDLTKHATDDLWEQLSTHIGPMLKSSHA
jgi:protein required for attachment to host cells